ncbi:MAG: hypothetical protein DMG06_16280 [Acidobacteria bacterium]|nr:MAG: hypothetical protein DMG06_16280 [Acidobacteriota bacterium]
MRSRANEPAATQRLSLLKRVGALPRINLAILTTFTLLPFSLDAGEGPYFITYDHHMEEPGNLEIAINPVLGLPKSANTFVGSWTEFEYGVKGWWTSEFYLNGQTTRHDSTLFTGFRWENRFRLLRREHWINPVFYLEFANVNAADKTLREVVGFGPEEEHAEPNARTRMEKEREIEGKLILSSNYKGWNFSENFIAEKNLSNEPWQFGYALGISHPLALAATPEPCSFCRENFHAGIEFYGGLGNWHKFGLPGASRYIAPVLAWDLPNGTTFRISPTFGLTENSHRALIRFGVSYEFAGLGRRLGHLFR